jgi:hypothetical protein
MAELLMFFFVSLAALLWYLANQGRERALFFARAECRKREVQLLDQTVQFERYQVDWQWPNWGLWRRYRFAYSIEGDERNHGELWFRGPRLIKVVMESEEILVH